MRRARVSNTAESKMQGRRELREAQRERALTGSLVVLGHLAESDDVPPPDLGLRIARLERGLERPRRVWKERARRG